MGTNIEDPLRRLAVVAISTRVAKSLTADASDMMPDDIALPGLPLLLSEVARVSEQLRLRNSAFNVVVSNVPGPRETLYSNGAKMLTHYPVSIPAHGIGVNLTVQSYAGGLYFGVTACESVLPDADVLRDDMIAAYDAFRSTVFVDPLPVAEVAEVAAFMPPAEQEPMVAESKGPDLDRVA